MGPRYKSMIIDNMYQIKTSSSPMFSIPSKKCSLETECLFGETVEIKEKYKNWSLCRLTSDNYEGWLESKDLSKEYKTTHNIIIPRTIISNKPDIKSISLGYLSLGSFVKVNDIYEDWARIDLNLIKKGKYGFIPKSHLIEKKKVLGDYVHISEKLINTPYKWGGRNTIGIDCSALVQLSLQTSKIFVPRNSSEQMNSHYFKPISCHNIKRGCLIFWEGHVAISINKSKIIHANAFHMKVEIENLSSAIKRMGKPVSIQTLKKY